MRVSVPGGVINCVAAGGGQAPAIVMLHGGPGAGHRQLEPLLSMFSPRRTITYDQLGCGLSDRPKATGVWTIERAVEELRSVLVALSVEDYHLFGHSWGATIALAAMADIAFPRPRSLVLSSPLISTRAWEADTLELMKPLYNEALNEGLAGSRAMERALAEFNARHWCRSSAVSALLLSRREDFGEDVYRAMWGTTEFRCDGSLAGLDLTHLLPGLGLPTLLTRGEHDMVSKATAERFVRVLPRGTTVTIERAAHLPFWEAPAPFRSAILQFLARAE